MRGVFEGVNYLHDLDYMHRDLKAENVMFKRNRFNGMKIETKLIDFGLSTQHKVLSFDEIDERIGTLIYMAPEQAES